MRVANSRYNAAAELQIRQNKGGSKQPQVERGNPILKLQTLEASPLSNRRSERPAEKPPANNKHSEGVPRLATIQCTSFSPTILFCQHFEKQKRKNERVDSSFFRSVAYFARICLEGIPNASGVYRLLKVSCQKSYHTTTLLHNYISYF